MIGGTVSRYTRHHPLLRHFIGLFIVPLALSSVGYALFSQDLSLATTTRKPAYSQSQGLHVSYGRSLSPQGQIWIYDMAPFTITNNGAFAVSAWTVTFTVPADASSINCTNAVCTLNGTTLSVKNTTTNGTIAIGGSVTPTVTFRVSSNTYLPDNINVSGVQDAPYQTYAGLTASFTRGARTKSGKWYGWPYTFTVTNNSGVNLSSWRIVGTPWDTTNYRVNSMQTTVDYVSSPTALTILSKSPLTTGNSFVFTANLGATNQNWNFTTPLYIEARP